MAENVLQGMKPPIPSDCPLKSIIEACWDDLPQNRPSFDQIIKELKNLMFHLFIKHEIDRNFWEELQSSTEIEWDQFEKKLTQTIKSDYEKMTSCSAPNPNEKILSQCSDYQLNIYSAIPSLNSFEKNLVKNEIIRRYKKYDGVSLLRPEFKVEMNCLKKLLRVDENQGKVLLNNFGNVMQWFGPIFDENHYPSFLGRVCFLFLFLFLFWVLLILSFLD